MTELIDSMVQHFFQGVILNMAFGLILTLKLTVFNILSNSNLSSKDLSSSIYLIYKEKSVVSTIPTCFKNKESHISCYKYNKPIRSTKSNYNKLVIT